VQERFDRRLAAVWCFRVWRSSYLLALCVTLAFTAEAKQVKRVPPRASDQFLQGSGFVGRPDVSLAPGTSAFALADFNRDGKIDAATVADSAGTASVLLGNGDGTFQSPVAYAVPANSIPLETGDFNGDGNPDLLVISVSTNPAAAASVSVLLGNGDGTFQAPLVTAISNSSSPFSRKHISEPKARASVLGLSRQ